MSGLGRVLTRGLSRRAICSLRNMNGPHLAQGSRPPPIEPGRITLYNMRFCPYAQRTVLVLLAKDIQFDIININLLNKPDWFLAKAPLGKVPVLETEGDILPESLITSDYLDERYPGNKLYPEDPMKKSQDRVLVQKLDLLSRNLLRVQIKDDPEDVEAAAEKVKAGLALYEQELGLRRKTAFFGGSKPGMADYMIWPWFERLGNVTKAAEVDLDLYPALTSWIGRMKLDDSVKAYLISPIDHVTFANTFKRGEQNYDLIYERESKAKLE